MGYFFRPMFVKNELYEDDELLIKVAKKLDAPNNQYGLTIYDGRQFAMWRFWGNIIHCPLYEDFINKLFHIYHDPCEPDDYEGDCIWRVKFNDVRKINGEYQISGDGFNHKYCDAFTMSECMTAFNELWSLMVQEDWVDSNDKEFRKDVAQSIQYIMLSKYRDYEAY